MEGVGGEEGSKGVVDVLDVTSSLGLFCFFEKIFGPVLRLLAYIFDSKWRFGELVSRIFRF